MNTEMIDTIDASVFGSLCEPVPAADFIDLFLQAGFSPQIYRDAYGDLSARGWTAQMALSHLFHHGLEERRAAPLTLSRPAMLALARLPMQKRAFKARLLTYLGSHLFDHIERPDGGAIAERWPTIQALTHEGGRAYFIAGDSHSHNYALTGTRDDAWMLPIHLLCSGGSAMGLGRPASRSGYGPLLRKAVQVVAALSGTEAVPFLLQFGQVDLEFVYHYQRVRDGKRALDLGEYRAFCDTTLDQYIRFTTELFAPADRSRVFLVSIFPPALSDEAWQEGYVNADIAQRETAVSVAQLSAGIRGIRIADLQQRSEIHAYFNTRLKAACRRHDFGYVDGMTPFLGDRGVVDPRFVIPETRGVEHHLDTRRTYDAIRNLIWHCIDATGQPRLTTSDP